MIIAAGADHAGFAVKAMLVRRLRALGHDVVDVGAADASQPDDYADFAHAVAFMVEQGHAERRLHGLDRLADRRLDAAESAGGGGPLRKRRMG